MSQARSYMYKVDKDRKAAKECTARPHASELEAAVARSAYEAAEGAHKEAAASVSAMLQELRRALNAFIPRRSS